MSRAVKLLLGQDDMQPHFLLRNTQNATAQHHSDSSDTASVKRQWQQCNNSGTAAPALHALTFMTATVPLCLCVQFSHIVEPYSVII